MIYECDFPFLVEDLCEILLTLIKDLSFSLDESLDKIKFDENDEDMSEFYFKIKKQLIKMDRKYED